MRIYKHFIEILSIVQDIFLLILCDNMLIRFIFINIYSIPIDHARYFHIDSM